MCAKQKWRRRSHCNRSCSRRALHHHRHHHTLCLSPCSTTKTQGFRVPPNPKTKLPPVLPTAIDKTKPKTYPSKHRNTFTKIKKNENVHPSKHHNTSTQRKEKRKCSFEKKRTKPPSKQASKYRNIFKQNTLDEERGKPYLVLLLGVWSKQKLVAKY